MTSCPCHSGKPYANCCQPLHQGQPPPMPAALMRSRYAAYALGKVSYIIKTEHPTRHPQQKDAKTYRKTLKWFCDHTEFVGLQILQQRTLSAEQATVTFHANLRQDGKDASFTEQSLFQKENGRWLYVKAIEEAAQ